MNVDEAKKEIGNAFGQYKAFRRADHRRIERLTAGKLYELYVLATVVQELAARGCRLSFRGRNLKFKAAPGKINLNDPHFIVTVPDTTTLRLFVDIEFTSFGSSLTNVTDNSLRHELDIVLVDDGVQGYPTHENIWLAVECKAVANFTKSILKEVLGVRRELSLLSPVRISRLSKACAGIQKLVPADPASEFEVAFIDEKGSKYSQSPKAFGIIFRHLDP